MRLHFPGTPGSTELGFPARATSLALAARLLDGIPSAALSALSPTLRTRFGLSYAEVSSLRVLGSYAEALFEPVLSLGIDRWSRRWLLVIGALGVALGTVASAVAPGYGLLLVAFAVRKATSPALRMTADVVLVELRPAGANGLMGRSAALNVAGSLLGPVLVAAALRAGLEWDALLIVIGVVIALYAALLAYTRFPAPASSEHVGGAGVLRDLRSVLSDRDTRCWLIFMRVYFVTEAVSILEPLWLADHIGMSQPLVATYMAFQMGAAVCGSLALDRIRTASPRRILIVATTAMLISIPPWFLLPGSLARFVVGAPLAFAWAMLWPVARGESIRSSERPGAVTAVSSLSGLLFIPFPIAIGLAGEAFGLTAVMLTIRMIGTSALLVMAWAWLPERGEDDGHVERSI